MLRILELIALLSIGAAALAGCGGEVQSGATSGDVGSGSGGGGGNAPSAAPTFAEVYTTIFETRGCANSYCHLGGEGSLALYDVKTAYQNLIGVTATGMGCGTATRVVPGDPDASLLYQKVAMTEPPCGKRMPTFASPLPAEEIEMIRAWIAAGAPE
jgi:hypothetical protein